MAKLFLASILSLVLLSASELLASSFGDVDFSGNNRYTTSGSNNKGSVRDNLDMTLRVTDCYLSVDRNHDLKVDELNTDLELSGNTRCEFRGRDNRVEGRANLDLRTDNYNSVVVLINTQVGNVRAEGNSHLYCSGNTRFEFRGYDDRVDALTNLDVKITSRSSNFILDNNHVLNIRVDNARLNAYRNTRLTVTGSYFEADVSNTVDHTIHRPRQFSNKPENSFKISRGNSSGINKRDTTSSLGPIVNIEVVDKVAINGSNYKIGEIEFTLKPMDNELYEVSFSNETLTKCTLKKQLVNDKEMVITATRDGKEQNLRIKGDKIIDSGESLNVLPMTKN